MVWTFFFPVFIRFSLHFGRLYAGEPAGEGGWKLGSCPSNRFLVCTVLSEFIFFLRLRDVPLTGTNTSVVCYCWKQMEIQFSDGLVLSDCYGYWEGDEIRYV